MVSLMKKVSYFFVRMYILGNGVNMIKKENLLEKRTRIKNLKGLG